MNTKSIAAMRQALTVLNACSGNFAADAHRDLSEAIKREEAQTVESMKATPEDMAIYRSITNPVVKQSLTTEREAKIKRLRENHHTWRDSIDRCMEAADMLAADAQAVVSDGVWEALQRLIESAETLGSASRDDALLVAQWRGKFRSQSDSSANVAQQVAVPFLGVVDCKSDIDVMLQAADLILTGGTLQRIQAISLLQGAAKREQVAVPQGMVLVPLKMNLAMRLVIEEEEWSWPELLAAAEAVTEEEYELALKLEENMPPKQEQGDPS